MRTGTVLRVAAPLAVGLLLLAAWQFVVWMYAVPAYVLPGPAGVWAALVAGWASLSVSLVITAEITAAALLTSALLGLLLAVLFAQSRLVELALFPYAVILQVTPIVAIAPLIIIWVNDTRLALLICAWIVAFFPVLANTTLGLNSVDRNLLDLFRLYHARRWQVLTWLRLPTALPYYLAGLRISGGLALIGAIVAEFVAGTGGAASGLAYRILEAGYQLKIDRMFAALALVSLMGVVIFALLWALSWLLLRHWHESAMGSGR